MDISRFSMDIDGDLVDWSIFLGRLAVCRPRSFFVEHTRHLPDLLLSQCSNPGMQRSKNKVSVAQMHKAHLSPAILCVFVVS